MTDPNEVIKLANAMADSLTQAVTTGLSSRDDYDRANQALNEYANRFYLEPRKFTPASTPSPDELDKKIAEIAHLANLSDPASFRTSIVLTQKLYPDLVADRDMLKRLVSELENQAAEKLLECLHHTSNDGARIAELEAALNSLLEMSSACTTDAEVIENNRRRMAARMIVTGITPKYSPELAGADHLPDADQDREHPDVVDGIIRMKDAAYQALERAGWEYIGGDKFQEKNDLSLRALVCERPITIYPRDLPEFRHFNPPPKPVELLTASTPVGSKVQALDRVMFPLQLEYLLEWRDAEDGAWRVSYEHDAIKPGHNGTKWQMTIPADRFHQFRVIAGPEEGGK